MNLTGTSVKLAENWSDHGAKIVLPDDEFPCCKRFRNKGPNAPELLNNEGKWFITFAEQEERVFRAEKAADPWAGSDASSLIEELDKNAGERKRENVALAMAKRQPKRQRRSMGTVEL